MIDFNQDGNFSNFYDNYGDQQTEIFFGDDLLYNSNGKDGKGGFKLLMQRLSKNSKKNDYLIC